MKNVCVLAYILVVSSNHCVFIAEDMDEIVLDGVHGSLFCSLNPGNVM